MRVFVAIDLPEDIRTRILAWTDTLRRQAPALRWSRPGGLHITLKFIGEISEEQVREARLHLNGLPPAPTFPISLRGSGFFPNARRPRTLWLGVEAGPELAGLAGRIDSELAAMKIPAESRPYTPHLTLARAEGSANLKQLADDLERAGKVEIGTFTADAYYIYQSTLGRGGSVYTKLFRIPMRGRAGSIIRGRTSQ